jgi:hypothetical protein
MPPKLSTGNCRKILTKFLVDATKKQLQAFVTQAVANGTDKPLRAWVAWTEVNAVNAGGADSDQSAVALRVAANLAKRKAGVSVKYRKQNLNAAGLNLLSHLVVPATLGCVSGAVRAARDTLFETGSDTWMALLPTLMREEDAVTARFGALLHAFRVLAVQSPEFEAFQFMVS